MQAILQHDITRDCADLRNLAHARAGHLSDFGRHERGSEPCIVELMDEPDDGEYNNTHKALLQAIMARSTFTFDEIQPTLAAILGVKAKRDYLVGDVTEADVNAYITSINHAISPFDYEIRSTYHQQTRQKIFSFVNSTSDPTTQLATTHSADEISYVKRILDAMFETYNTKRHEVMAVTSMQAVKLARTDRRTTQNGEETQGSSGQGLTLKEGERVLKGLVQEGWFDKSRKGFYSLSPRALMELRGWLVETYNLDDEEDPVFKIKNCDACKEIITSGQRCHNRECLGRLHDICTQRFFTMQKSRTCPRCKAEWTGKDFVGERAAVDMKAKARAQQRGSTNGSTIRQQSPTVIEEEETRGAAEDEEDEEEEAGDGDAEEETEDG